MCRFPHLFHKWRLYDWYHYTDVSYGGNEPSTAWVLACNHCGETKKDLAYGETLDEKILRHRFRGWSKFSGKQEKMSV